MNSFPRTHAKTLTVFSSVILVPREHNYFINLNVLLSKPLNIEPCSYGKTVSHVKRVSQRPRSLATKNVMGSIPRFFFTLSCSLSKLMFFLSLIREGRFLFLECRYFGLAKTSISLYCIEEELASVKGAKLNMQVTGNCKVEM